VTNERLPIVERLRATDFDANSSRAPYQKLRNPDGPEAADTIELLVGALELGVAIADKRGLYGPAVDKMREALASVRSA
jgi:hypothetical protein